MITPSWPAGPACWEALTSQPAEGAVPLTRGYLALSLKHCCLHSAGRDTEARRDQLTPAPVRAARLEQTQGGTQVPGHQPWAPAETPAALSHSNCLLIGWLWASWRTEAASPAPAQACFPPLGEAHRDQKSPADWRSEWISLLISFFLPRPGK